MISGVEFHDKHDFDTLRLIQHLNQEMINIYRLVNFFTFLNYLVFPSILEENNFQIRVNSGSFTYFIVCLNMNYYLKCTFEQHYPNFVTLVSQSF